MGFSKEEFGEVRTLVEGENIWFNLNDICRALDLRNPRKVVNDLPKGVTNSYPLSTFKQTIYFFSCEHIFIVKILCL